MTESVHCSLTLSRSDEARNEGGKPPSCTRGDTVESPLVGNQNSSFKTCPTNQHGSCAVHNMDHPSPDKISSTENRGVSNLLRNYSEMSYWFVTVQEKSFEWSLEQWRGVKKVSLYFVDTVCVISGACPYLSSVWSRCYTAVRPIIEIVVL